MSSKKKIEELFEKSSSTTLDVTKLTLSLRDVQALAKRLEEDNHFITVKVDGYRIGDDGATALAHVLLKNTTIQR